MGGVPLLSQSLAAAILDTTSKDYSTRFIGFNKISRENISGKRAASGGAGLIVSGPAKKGKGEEEEGEGGWGEWVYSPVREKEHCGLCVPLLMLGFMPKATVAKRTSQRARRLGLHTVATAFTALGSAGRRPRRQWRSACAMRLARSAPSWS